MCTDLFPTTSGYVLLAKHLLKIISLLWEISKLDNTESKIEIIKVRWFYFRYDSGCSEFSLQMLSIGSKISKEKWKKSWTLISRCCCLALNYLSKGANQMNRLSMRRQSLWFFFISLWANLNVALLPCCLALN